MVAVSSPVGHPLWKVAVCRLNYQPRRSFLLDPPLIQISPNRQCASVLTNVIHRRGTRLRREIRCCRWSRAFISRSPLLVVDTHTARQVWPWPRSPRRAGVRTTHATGPTSRARAPRPCSRWPLVSRRSSDHPRFFAGKGLDPRTFVLLWFAHQLLQVVTTSKARWEISAHASRSASSGTARALLNSSTSTPASR